MNKINNLESFQKTAHQKYQNNFVYDFNVDSTFILCKSIMKSTSGHPQQTVNYFVFNNLENKTVIEESIPNGTVEWYDKHNLRIEFIPGTISGDESAVNENQYLINVVTKNRTNINRTSK